MKNPSISLVIASLAVSSFFGQSVTAQCTGLTDISGQSLQSRYAGSVNVVQNNPTGFGDAAPANTSDTEGSELDRLFVTNNAATLYIGITGNTPRHDNVANTVLVFIDTDAGATPLQLATSGFTGPNISQALKNMSGVTLDFDPDYCLALWNDIGTGGGWHGVLHNLHNANDAGTLLTQGTDFAVDDSNLVGVSNTPGDDPLQQQEQAATATNGFEFALALATLGINSSSTIRIQALIANSAGGISNQSLPPLKPTSGTDGGKVACLGVYDATNNPIDLSSGTYPANQYVSVTLAPGGLAPVLPIDGNGIPSPSTGYPTGTERAKQNNFTCFGDAAAYSPGVTGGNELDLLYVLNDFAKLYIGVAGNIELPGGITNAMLLFIQTNNSAATNTLATANFPQTLGPGVLQNLDGFTFDANFAPDWVVMIWRDGNQIKAIRQNLDNDGAETPLVFTIDANNHKNAGINAISTDLTNTDGVNDVAGDDPIRQTGFAKTAKKGVQVSLVLSELGIANPIGQQVKVFAMIASNSDGGTNAFVSNQGLPPLNPTPASGTPVLSSDTFNVNQPITDAGVIFSTQTATNAAPLARVTGCKVTVNINHPDVSQLKVDLRHDDSGRRIRLFNASGTGANMNNTVFVEGGTPLTSWTAGGTGNWQPVDSLLTFNDVDPNPSTWTLIVEDTTSGLTGTLVSWKLDLQWDKGGAAPCPGTQNTDPLQGTVNTIDLSNETLFPGNQYATKNLVNASGPVPSQFSSHDVPAYFGDSDPNRPNALAVQNNYTCFGNAAAGQPQSSAGNELDQLFITNSDNRIQVALTGNQELNGNGVVLLLDTVSGGENTLTGNPTPPGPLGGDPNNQTGAPGLNGLTLDSGFNPDFAITGVESGGKWQVHLTNLTTNINRFVGNATFNSGNGFLEAPVTNGSEMDQLFVMNDATNLYLGITGNIEGNSNGYVIFLDTIAGGSNVLNTAGGNGWPGQITGMSGDTLPTGFAPDFAVVVSRSGPVYNTAKLVNLSTLPNVPVDITFAANFVISPNTFVGNNNNYLGVNDVPADDPGTQSTNAATASSGVQLALQRSSIGNPANGATVKVYGVLVGSGGYWSNQSLPPLSASGGLANQGNGPVNASGATAASYVMNASGTAPGSYNGQNIPGAGVMGPGLKATQDNYTGFGNQVLAPGGGNTNCMQVALDRSNLGGVNGCNCPCIGGSTTNAGNVDTGYEFDIPLADIGLTGPIGAGNMPTIRVMAVLTGNTGYMSNQFLPGIGGAGAQCNLGWPTAAPQNNLANYSGNQYLTYNTISPCSSIAGDIDGNGVRDINDAPVLVNVLLGTDTNACHVQKADVDGNGLRNGRDISAFVHLLVP